MSKHHGRTGTRNGLVGTSAGFLELLEPRLLLDAWYVDAAAGEGGDGTSPATAFQTIQAGIDAAGGGDTVHVAAGSYAEDLAIDVGVEVIGADAAATILAGQHAITSGAVRLRGFTFDLAADQTAFTVDSSGGAISGVGITDSTFSHDEGPGIGIWLGGPTPTNPISNVEIADNVFSGPDSKIANPFRIGGYFGGGAGLAVELTDLAFTGNIVDSASIPIQLANQNVGNVLIESNLFANTDGAVYVWSQTDDPTGVLSDFVFRGNDVDATNSYGLGIDLDGATKLDDANFGSGNLVQYNSFGAIAGKYGFGAVSLLSPVTTYELDATQNYWGDATGPAHASNPGGAGGLVSDNVDYSPWWHADYVGDGADPWTWHTNDSIQDAIDAAGAGDTIQVGAGVYTESLAIDKRIEIVGADMATTTIVGRHVITAGSVDVSGFTFDPGGDNTAITVDSGGGVIDGVTVSDSTFDYTDDEGIGIWLGGATPVNAITNVEIADSVFSGPATQIANPWKIGGYFGGGPGLAVEVTGVSFTGNTVDRMSTPIQLANKDIANVLIDDNVFTNTDGAVYVWSQTDDPTGVLSGFVFTNNDVDGTNSYGVGIDLDGATKFGDANFGTGNRINGNSFGAGIPGAYGFGAVSLLSDVTTYQLDATGNWWGSANGPTIASNTFNAGAQGDAITDTVPGSVAYAPWLDAEGGDPFAPVTNATQATYHASIQAGADAATAGDELTLAAGTFEENVSLTKALTIQGAGAGQTLLQGAAGGVVMDVSFAGDAENVLTVSGMTIQPVQAGTAADDWPVRIAPGSAYVTIADCTVDTSNAADQAVSMPGDGPYDQLTFRGNTILFGSAGIDFNPDDPVQGAKTNITIDGNTLMPTTADYAGIRIENATGLTVSNSTWTAPPSDGAANSEAILQEVTDLTLTGNTFVGSGTDEASYGVYLEGIHGTSVVAGNRFSGFRVGAIVTQGPAGTGTDGLVIGGDDLAEGNVFTQCTYGLTISDSGDGAIAGLTIQGNAFYASDLGLRVGDSTTSPEDDIVAGGYTIQGNHFDLSNGVALKNEETTEGGPGDDTLRPTGNWWGDPTGPTHPTNPDGFGAFVEGLADFSDSDFGARPTNPQPDLTATVDTRRVSLPDTIVPGDRGRVTVLVDNISDGKAAGLTTVKVFLRPTAGSDIEIGQVTTSVGIAGGASKAVAVRVNITSEVPDGSYSVVAQVDTADTIDEVNEDNNEGVGNLSLTAVRQCGAIAGRRGRTRLVLPDPVTGADVTFRVVGPGTADVTTVLGTGFDVTLQDTTSRTKLIVKTPRGQTATLNDVTAERGFAALLGATSDLVGALNVGGPLSNLTLGSVADGTADIGGSVKNLSAVEWVAGNVDIAGRLGRLNIKGNRLGGIAGDFGADLDVANAGSAAFGLRTATIKGGVTGATWTVQRGDVQTVKIVGEASTFGLNVPNGGIRTLTMGNAGGVDVLAGGPAGTVRAGQWVQGSLSATRIDTLQITGRGGSGDLDGVQVTADNPGGDFAVRNVNVAGSMRDAAVQAAGNVGIVQVGRDMDGSSLSASSTVSLVRTGKMIDSTIFAGVANPPDVLPGGGDGVYDLPSELGAGDGQIDDGHAITRVDVLGYLGAEGTLFANSNIAARTIGLVSLRSAQLDNAGTPFGVAGEAVGIVTLQQGGTAHVWRGGTWTPALDALDLAIRQLEVAP